MTLRLLSVAVFAVTETESTAQRLNSWCIKWNIVYSDLRWLQFFHQTLHLISWTTQVVLVSDVKLRLCTVAWIVGVVRVDSLTAAPWDGAVQTLPAGVIIQREVGNLSVFSACSMCNVTMHQDAQHLEHRPGQLGSGVCVHWWTRNLAMLGQWRGEQFLYTVKSFRLCKMV